MEVGGPGTGVWEGVWATSTGWDIAKQRLFLESHYMPDMLHSTRNTAEENRWKPLHAGANPPEGRKDMDKIDEGECY